MLVPLSEKRSDFRQTVEDSKFTVYFSMKRLASIGFRGVSNDLLL